MKIPTDITYQVGMPETCRAQAVALYDEAFGEKFGVAISDARIRQRVFQDGLRTDFAIVALDGERLLGIAGFQTPDGALTGGINFAILRARLGWFGSIRAALVFALYERKPARGELVMDGIAVTADARGRGIGGKLLDEICGYAKAHGFTRVRLDVIDRNPKARKLYARKGFVVTKTEHFPYLRRWLTFGGVATMEWRVGATPQKP